MYMTCRCMSRKGRWTLDRLCGLLECGRERDSEGKEWDRRGLGDEILINCSNEMHSSTNEENWKHLGKGGKRIDVGGWYIQRRYVEVRSAVRWCKAHNQIGCSLVPTWCYKINSCFTVFQTLSKTESNGIKTHTKKKTKQTLRRETTLKLFRSVRREEEW